jgi:hypothetical protein
VSSLDGSAGKELREDEQLDPREKRSQRLGVYVLEERSPEIKRRNGEAAEAGIKSDAVIFENLRGLAQMSMQQNQHANTIRTMTAESHKFLEAFGERLIQ